MLVRKLANIINSYDEDNDADEDSYTGLEIKRITKEMRALFNDPLVQLINDKAFLQYYLKWHNANEIYSAGYTLSHWITALGEADLLDLVLSKMDDVNTENEFGEVPLFMIFESNPDINLFSRLLLTFLNYGADTSKVDGSISLDVYLKEMKKESFLTVLTNQLAAQITKLSK